MVNIERIQSFMSGESASEIDGWFFPLDQRAFLEIFNAQNQLQIKGDVVEIGVHHGKSLVLLSLLKSADERLLGFDLFHADSQEKTEQNIHTHGESTGLSLVKGLTSDIARADLDSLLPKPLRFLHIDAGHEYHEVLEQLVLFSPYLSDHGIIAMDDYQDREFPGIEAAVLDFAEIDRPRRFVPFLASGNKLFMCCAQFANIYQLSLLGRLGDTWRLTRVKDFNVLIMRSKLPVATEIIKAQLAQTNFPNRPDADVSLSEKSAQFGQISFGSGHQP